MKPVPAATNSDRFRMALTTPPPPPEVRYPDCIDVQTTVTRHPGTGTVSVTTSIDLGSSRAMNGQANATAAEPAITLTINIQA